MDVHGWITFVERSGGEVPVTLLVSGALVTGTLTPWARYCAWETEVTARVLIGGAPQRLPDVPMGPIAPQQAATVRERWDAQAEQHPSGADRTYTHFALRDADVRPPNGGRWRLPYLVVYVAVLGAFALGTMDAAADDTGPAPPA